MLSSASRSQRRWFVWSLLAIGCLLVGVNGSLLAQNSGTTQDSATEQPQVSPPNILFIFSDDHAVQAIGAYGSTLNQTPHLDRLAAQGMIFDRSYCTNSICGPSRASILTGLHSHLNGFRRNGDRFDGSQWVFPRALQENGYQTALIGKWHLETDPTGFDYWKILPGQGHYYNPDFIHMDKSRQRDPGYCTDLITEDSIQWLEKRDRSKPFLLMSQHKAPHRNWAPHPRHFGRYKLGSNPVPATLRDDYSGRSRTLADSEMSIRNHFYWGHDMKFHGPNQLPQYFLDGIPNGEYARMTDEQKAEWDAYYQPENDAFLAQVQAGELSDDEVLLWKYQRYMHDYLGSVQAVDDSVGRLLDYLDQSGLAENTIVVYASDQGFYLGEHGWYDKRWMFEESFRMPLIVRWPGQVPAGTRSSALVQNIDYAPTFLQAAGIEVPAQVQGRSLLPVLQGDGQAPSGWRDALYYAYYENDSVHEVAVHDGVRTDRYKLMFFPRTNEWNLFDLESDPQELRSVHEDPQYQAVLAGMKQRYRDLRGYYGVNSATIPVTRGDEAWWKARDREKSALAKQQAYPLVFIGDSITQGWEGPGKEAWEAHFAGVPALNLGFSGDRTEHVLWRLQQGQLGISRPSTVVLLIGTNNTGHRMQAPAEIAEGVSAIVAELRKRTPESKIIVLGILPRGESALDAMRLNNVAVNQHLRRLDDGQHVFFHDLSSVFLESDGSLSREIMPDLLHLSPTAYHRWAEALVPLLP